MTGRARGYRGTAQNDGRRATSAQSAAKARALRPRDAATLIIIDSSSGEPRVLLGRRRLDMVFMPGRYVFPGGRVDPADKLVDVEDDLAPREIERLMVAMKGTRSVARARSLALAAVRETFEEAGLLIGTPLGESAAPKVPDWQEFFATGFRPALGRLTFFARAITPPGRPRRFDSRFFCVEAEAIVHRAKIAGRRAVGPRMALDRPGALARAAQHHAGGAGGLERAHRRRRAAHRRFSRAVLPPAQRQFPARPHRRRHRPRLNALTGR